MSYHIFFLWFFILWFFTYLDGVFRVLAGVKEHKTEAAGGEFMSIETHNDATNIPDFTKHIVDLVLRREK